MLFKVLYVRVVKRVDDGDLSCSSIPRRRSRAIPSTYVSEWEINHGSSSASPNTPSHFHLLHSLLFLGFMQTLNQPSLTSPPPQNILALVKWKKKKTPPTDVQLKKRAPPPPPPPFLFKVSEEHYQAGPSRAETFPNPNLPADPSLAFNNCRHSLALLCDHAWMKSVKQLPELLGCLRLTFPQSKIYDLRARICHGNGSNLPP